MLLQERTEILDGIEDREYMVTKFNCVDIFSVKTTFPNSG